MPNRLCRFILLALVGSLAACASSQHPQDAGAPSANFNPSKDPYWEDPRWDEALLDTVQAAIHDPANPSDISAPNLHATVKFTYLQGVLEYPEIVTGTGDPEMDKLMLHQLASVQAPQASGLRSDEPHEFVLDLDMPTPFETFQSSIYAAIDASKLYPKDAIISGSTGTTTVAFDYVDGKARGIVQAKSSDNKLLDRTSVDTVTKATMPPAPSTYAGKTLHMEVQICYALNTAKYCPSGRNVILVLGTRIKRTDVVTRPRR